MSRKALNILERMKQTQSGWRPHHFHTLYLGFGYIKVEAKKHDILVHPDYPQLEKVTIPRHHEELSKAYARDAIKDIELLLKLEIERDESNE